MGDFKVGDNVRVVTKEKIGRDDKSHFGMLGKVVDVVSEDTDDDNIDETWYLVSFVGNNW